MVTTASYTKQGAFDSLTLGSPLEYVTVIDESVLNISGGILSIPVDWWFLSFIITALISVFN